MLPILKKSSILSWLFAASFFFLPFGMGGLTNLLLMLALIYIFLNTKREDWAWAFRQPLVHFSLAFYLIYVASLLYTYHLSDGLSNLETKLSFLIAPPAILAYTRQADVSERVEKLKIFVWGNLTVFLGLLVYAVYRTLQAKNWYYIKEGGEYKRYFFSYQTFAEPAMHPGYLSTFVGFSLLICLYFILTRQKQKWFWYIAFTLLSAEMILLQGRMNILALGLVIFGYAVYLAFARKAYKLILIPVLAASLLTAALLTLAPTDFKDRYLAFPDFSYDISGDTFNSATYRLAEWKGAANVIADYPILGAGVGDAEHELFKAYREIGFWQGLNYRFNAHNQYLETMLATGIPGLLALLGILISIGYTTFKRQDTLLTLSLLFFALCMITESMLERAWAVILFNVFFAYFSGMSQVVASKQKTTPKKS